MSLINKYNSFINETKIQDIQKEYKRIWQELVNLSQERLKIEHAMNDKRKEIFSVFDIMSENFMNEAFMSLWSALNFPAKKEGKFRYYTPPKYHKKENLYEWYIDEPNAENVDDFKISLFRHYENRLENMVRQRDEDEYWKLDTKTEIKYHDYYKFTISIRHPKGQEEHIIPDNVDGKDVAKWLKKLIKSDKRYKKYKYFR